MKARLEEFRAFINKHIWADFLYVFIIYGMISYLLSGVFDQEGDEKGNFLLNTAIFTLFMTPIFRFIRKTPVKPHSMELGDHAAYFAKGQRPQLKNYLESKGYTVNRNDGATTFFDPAPASRSHLSATFIFETEHWMALIAAPEIQANVPKDIQRLYPLTNKAI